MNASPRAAPAAIFSRVVQSSGVRPGPRLPVGNELITKLLYYPFRIRIYNCCTHVPIKTTLDWSIKDKGMVLLYGNDIIVSMVGSKCHKIMRQISYRPPKI